MTAASVDMQQLYDCRLRAEINATTGHSFNQNKITRRSVPLGAEVSSDRLLIKFEFLSSIIFSISISGKNA